MHTVIAPLAVKAVATEVTKAAGPFGTTTTLYDVIAAMQATIGPDEDALVVATVDRLLRTGRIAFVGHMTARDWSSL